MPTTERYNKRLVDAQRDPFVAAYVDAIIFTDMHSDTELSDATIHDFSVQLTSDIIRDCRIFQAGIARFEIDDNTRVGHDFWLTRNGHGAGFWDGDWPGDGEFLTQFAQAFGNVEMYLGDDEQVHA